VTETDDDGTASDADQFLVPVADSVTIRETVAYALERAAAALPDGDPSVHFVYVTAARIPPVEALDEPEAGRELLDRIEVWAEEDLGEDRDGVTVATAVLGTDRYLFGPPDYARVLREYASEHGLGRILLDPEYAPGGAAPMLQPLEAELARGAVPHEVAPVERPARRTGLARAATLSKYLVVFGATLAFYLAIGEFSTFDLLTGFGTAVVVSAILAPVTFASQPSLARIARQSLRLVLYVPYLVWEIAKANVAIAYVVLHPSLPIDPKVVRFHAAVWGDVPVTTLANSITLTPGTLTVDVRERSFAIHTLTRQARRDLYDGALERAVRFVFWGRAAARIPSPRERESIGGSEATSDREPRGAVDTTGEAEE